MFLPWQVLSRNGKRRQMAVNERMVAGDGFMLNFLSVMQMLSAKVRLDKVDPTYLLTHPNSRVDIKDDTRIRMTTEEAEEWKRGIKTAFAPAKFSTECWFLTLQAHHLSVLPCIRRYQRRLRALRELQKAVEELEKMEKGYEAQRQAGGAAAAAVQPMAAKNRAVLKRYKNQVSCGWQLVTEHLIKKVFYTVPLPMSVTNK